MAAITPPYQLRNSMRTLMPILQKITIAEVDSWNDRSIVKQHFHPTQTLKRCWDFLERSRWIIDLKAWIHFHPTVKEMKTERLQSLSATMCSALVCCMTMLIFWPISNKLKSINVKTDQTCFNECSKQCQLVVRQVALCSPPHWNGTPFLSPRQAEVAGYFYGMWVFVQLCRLILSP